MLRSITPEFRPVVVLAAWLFAAALGLPLRTVARSPDTAPPLPAPTGTVIRVSTEAALRTAVASAPSGATILIAPGTYQLSATLWINRAVNDLTIRGATNNRHDVVLAGRGMANANYGAVPHGIWTGGGVTRITIANLTIRDVYFHPLIFNGGTEQPRVYNVRLLDAGEQFLKANPDAAGGGVDGGRVEYSVFEYTTQARGTYTNGVDVHAGQDWVIRHNLFRRIRSGSGLAGPAVLMWNRARGTVVDGNTFIDCHRDISLGLVARTPDDHTGGVVRNNMIVRRPGAGGDVAIAVFDSPGTRVVHNTVLLQGAYPNAIEYRFSNTTGVTIVNNLADRPAVARDGAVATLAGNVWTAGGAWFVNPGAGDLHLLSGAAGAIDRGVVAADTTTDWDGQPRPAGRAADIGADERPTAIELPVVEICGDAVDNDGDGLVDEDCPPTALTPPGPASRLQSDIDGGSVRLRWLAPITGGPAETYIVEAGVAPGAPVMTAPVGPVTTVTFPAVPPGTYFVRVRAANAAGAGPPTAEIAVSPQCATPPGPPRSLAAAVAGGAVTFSWADERGCADTRYRLLAGSAPGLSNLATLPATTTSVFAMAPAGQYYVRVVSEWQGVISAPSAEINVAITGGCPPPAVALTLSGAAAPGTLTLRWSPVDAAAAEAVDRAAALHYVVEAGRSRGASDVGTFVVGRTTALSSPVPPGAYAVRVRAANACGAGPASNELLLAVP